MRSLTPALNADGEWELPGGWHAETRSFYDEEGVEGWVWIDASGEERYWELGGWHEPPPVPEEMIR